MSYSITTVKADLEGILHGTTISQITNPYGLFNRAARQLLLDIDPQETIRVTEITNPIMDKVWEYPLPSDVKGTKVIDIRPQVNRGTTDVFLHRYNQQFDVQKILSNQDTFTINFNSSVKTARINAPGISNNIQIEDATSVTGNGAWVTDGAFTSNISQDNVNYAFGSSSIRFDFSVPGPSNGWIENSTFSQVDLSDHKNESIILVYVYIPDATYIGSLDLQWGSSSSDNWSASTSTRYDGTAFRDGWNLIGFDWATASENGTPDSSKINFLQFTPNSNGATTQSGFRINNIISNLGVIMEIEYYSKFLFRDGSTGAYKETVTSDNDLVNLDTESYNLFFYQVALMAAQQQQGSDALQYDGPIFEQKYQMGLQKYKNQNKSQWQLPQSTYYQPAKPNYAKYINRRNF